MEHTRKLYRQKPSLSFITIPMNYNKGILSKKIRTFSFFSISKWVRYHLINAALTTFTCFSFMTYCLILHPTYSLNIFTFMTCKSQPHFRCILPKSYTKQDVYVNTIITYSGTQTFRTDTALIGDRNEYNRSSSSK